MAAGDTRRLKVVIEGDSRGGETAFERTGVAAKRAQSRLGDMAKFLGMFAIRGSVALGAVAVAAGTMGLKTATQLEQVQVGFTTMLGSAEKAKKFMKQLQDFAAATPFEFTELVGSAQRFLAMGFAAQEIIPMLTAVGDAVAAMGGSGESIDRVTLALGQMQAKGKVSSEELMQLTEQGIPALQILADKYGVTTAQMQKMITKGQVQSEKAIPALIDGLSKGTKHVQGFGGMMQKQSETMAGKWSTFMDNLTMGLGVLVSGTTPMLKKWLQFTSDAIQDFFAGLQGKGKLAGFTGVINEIGLGLRAMVKAFKEGDVTSKGLVGAFELVGAAGHGVIEAFKSGKVESGGWRGELELIAVVLGHVVDILGQTALATIRVAGWFKQHETITKILATAIFALIVLVKAHAAATAISEGAISKWWKATAIATNWAKVSAAAQWAWNGAVNAAKYTQIAGYLGALAVKQKAIAFWNKIVTASQWLWNIALTANPIGIVIAAIVLFIGAIALLWIKSEGFRNWVLSKLWPSIKRAWEQMKGIAMAVADAMVAAWNWIRDTAITVWNAIIGFLTPIARAIWAVLKPIITVIETIGNILWIVFNNSWKVVWILIQIAVKLFLLWFQGTLVPAFKAAIAIISRVLDGLKIEFNAIWGAIKSIINAVVMWINRFIVPAIKFAFDKVKGFLRGLRDWFKLQWDQIVNAVRGAVQVITVPIAAAFKAGLDKIRGWLNLFRVFWNQIYDKLRDKVNGFKDGVVKGFNIMKDGIGAAWNKITELAKKPINFIIGSIYSDRLVPMWNRLAEKFGIKTRLDTIPRLAKGGIAPGTGFGDKVPALLTPGEGVLTKKEMKNLGGPKGFMQLREQIKAEAMFNRGGIVQRFEDGGVVGFFKGLAKKGKDIFQGVAGNLMAPLAKIVKNLINSSLDKDGFSGLLRSGGNRLVDNFMAWVRGKDKEIPPLGSLGAGGGEGFGWRWMRSVISKRFPNLNMISGFRPGARTLSGRQSYHALGRAVDYPPNKALALWIRATYGKFTKELITPWNELNLNNGRPHRYSGAVWNQHNFAGGNAHDHWAMDKATTVDPGWFTGYNGTGKRETLVNSDMIPGFVIHGGVHLHGVQDVKALRDELLKLAKRNGGRSGLPVK